MWNRAALRTRITVLTMLALTLAAVTLAMLCNCMELSILIAALSVLLGTLFVYVASGHALKPARILAEKICRSCEAHKYFAQNAAHELKTPLASTLANIEALQLGGNPSEDEYKEAIDTVKTETKRLIDMVEGLLLLGNTTQGKNWGHFDGSGIFGSIINELKTDIEQKTIKINLTGDCRLTGDKVLLERAFFNVVHNAVRYNVENGKVNIALSENGINIKDSGIGIPAEHLPHILEPFYCVDKSHSRKLGGHGLGLSLAKNIFEKHDMQMQITSEPGRGTKIFLMQQK